MSQAEDQKSEPTPQMTAAFDVAVERTKKALARNPQISAADLLTRFVLPLLGEMRSEYTSLLDEYGDQLDEINEALDTLDVPDEDMLEQAKQLVLMLGNLVDNTFARVGWTGPQGPTENMPPDIQQAFRLAAGETRSFFERLSELEDEDDEEDEEEEDDEEDEDDEGAEEGPSA